MTSRAIGDLLMVAVGLDTSYLMYILPTRILGSGRSFLKGGLTTGALPGGVSKNSESPFGVAMNDF